MAGPHHRGAHPRIAKAITTAAKANPSTRCAKCHNTLDQCGPHHNGRNRNGTPCTWEAGHIVDGDARYGYQIECSHCNRSSGAKAGNAKRVEPHSEHW